MPSPFGPLTLLASANGLAAVLFRPPPKFERAGWDGAGDLLAETRRQLTEYFSGLRRRFALSLDLRGTPFQLRVWQALCDIPYGETITYSGLARRVGNPAAARAVGLANARNPISIIVPLPPRRWFFRRLGWLRRRFGTQALPSPVGGCRQLQTAFLYEPGELGDPKTGRVEITKVESRRYPLASLSPVANLARLCSRSRLEYVPKTNLPS